LKFPASKPSDHIVTAFADAGIIMPMISADDKILDVLLIKFP
jgi:hypothetical protein